MLLLGRAFLHNPIENNASTHIHPTSPHPQPSSLPLSCLYDTFYFYFEFFVSVIIACLSPPEYKVQEGKSFVLFTTISLVPKEPPTE